MRKKLFALALGLIAATSIIAQSTDSTQTGTPVEATIDSSEILYWVGSGENSAILAVNWLDTALAWGYRWSGTATVQSMLYGIASADTRFSVYIYSTNLNNINYHEGAVNLTLSPNSFWRDRLNGGYCQGLSQSLANGDFVKCADYNAHITTDSTYNETYPGSGYWSYNEVYATPIHPVTNPNSGIDTTSGGNTDTIPGGGGGANDSISGGGTDSTGFGSVYHLSVHSSNSALGCVLGGGDYPAGSQVVLYAVPKAGKVFNMWTGPDTLGSSNIVSTSNPYTVTVNGNISLFASFSECAGATHDTISISAMRE